MTTAETTLERSESLHERVRCFIRQSVQGPSDESFISLARDITGFQIETNPLLARLCSANEVQASNLSQVDEIPAIPTEIFRLKRVASHDPSFDLRCFETSGTTQGSSARGRHPMRTVATYELAAMTWARRWLWPDTDDLDLIVLAPSEEALPSSSLSFMLARFADELKGQASWHLVGDHLDIESVHARCASAISRGRPALIAGTSFAFVHLCDAWSQDPRSMPSGTRIMQTGGFKGRSREVAPDALAAMMSQCLGVKDDHIVGEYGMTELSSQLYQGQLRGKASRYHPPPWLHVRAVDPVSLRPVEQGQVGIARFVDLANIDSAIAIQTADCIREHEDGSVELLGRQPEARARGCSLAVEHLLDDSPTGRPS